MMSGLDGGETVFVVMTLAPLQRPVSPRSRCRSVVSPSVVPQSRRGELSSVNVKREKEWSIIIEESHSGEVVISISIFLVSYLDSPLQPHLTVSSVLVTQAKSNIQLLNSLNNDSYSLTVCMCHSRVHDSQERR